MNKKHIIGIIFVIIIIFLGCSVYFGQSHVNRADDELVVAAYSQGGEPESGFDPILGWNKYAEPLIQSTLLKMNRNMTYKKDLAEDYEISDDYKTYTVKLKPGIKFTDNTTLDAEDVAFTYNEAKKSGSSLDLSSMNNATAINDTTVQFNLNKSDSTFIDKLAHIGIVPSDSYNNETYGSNPVGSGPWKFVQWDKGQQVILEKNKEYYGNQSDFNKLTILFEKNEAAFNAAKNHELDIAAVPLTYANETVDGMKMYLLDSVEVRGISLPNVNNTGETNDDGNPIGNNVTSDISIRKALNYGINRTVLNEGALKGLGIPNYDGIAHKLPWANNETAIDDGDITKAKKILEDGGWKDTNGDGIREKNGLKASFKLYYFAEDPERQAVAVSVAEQAKELGIEIEPIGGNWDEIDPNINSQPVVWGFGSTDPTTIWSEYHSSQIGKGYNNPSIVNNSIFDSHIDAALASDLESSYSQWSNVVWDGSNGIAPGGDASWLWIGEIKYGYFVDDSLDISNDTALLQPHCGDIFGNLNDWKRVSSINN